MESNKQGIMKYLLFGIILCLLSACAITDQTSENNRDVVMIRSESAVFTYNHPSICEDCILIKPEAGSGTCKHCGNITDSKSYKYCTKCSKRYYACARCLGPLDEDAYLNDILFSMKLKGHVPEKKSMGIAWDGKLNEPTPDDKPYRLKTVCNKCKTGGTYRMVCGECKFCGAVTSLSVVKLCRDCSYRHSLCTRCLNPIY